MAEREVEPRGIYPCPPRQGVIEITLELLHGEQIAIPALPVSPIDTVGAGDAFCGAFAAALDAGESFSTALRWGCVAGSLTCLKTGAQTALPTREEIAAHLSSLPA